jgi:hypothetical protein
MVERSAVNTNERSAQIWWNVPPLTQTKEVPNTAECSAVIIKKVSKYGRMFSCNIK